VIVSVQNANVTTNGTGSVDVLISSSLASKLLSTTGFVFQISGSPNLTGSLEFLSEPIPLHVSPPNYVFGAATGNYFDSLGSSTEISAGDWFGAGDSNVVITTATQTLVRLNLKHTAIGDSALAVGSTFTIGLDSSAANDFSFWDNSDPDPGFHGPVSLDIAPSSLTNLGTITITSAAVPEPGTAGMLSLAAVALVGRRLRRGRREFNAITEQCDCFHHHRSMTVSLPPAFVRRV
jgi:hypothetical protein